MTGPSTLSLAEARSMAARAVAAADRLGVPICVCVVDPHGVAIVLERMDGAPWAAAKIASAKALAAAALGPFCSDTVQMYERMESSGFWSTAPTLFSGTVAFGAGGRPVRRGVHLVGAVGISGGNASQDTEIADSAATEG